MTIARVLAFQLLVATAFVFVLGLGDSFPLPSISEFRFGNQALAAAGVVRLFLLVVIGYLFVAGVVSGMAAITKLPTLLRLSQAVSPTFIRRLTGAALVAAVSIGSVAPAHAFNSAIEDSPKLRRLQPTTTTTTAPVTSTIAPLVTSPTPPTTTATPNAPAKSEAAPPQPVQPDSRVHVVRSGENFWSIAAQHAGPNASEEGIHKLWQDLISANSDRLVDRRNANLLLPGQKLVIPE